MAGTSGPCGVPVSKACEQAGYTLIELLVVLAILALVGVLVMGIPTRRDPGIALDIAAGEIKDGLRLTRDRAMLANRDAAFTLDLQGRSYVIDDQRPVQLPKVAALALYTARSELLAATRGSIRFFPDGSSTGGRIRLGDDHRRLDVQVEWLTGRVTMGSPP